MRAGTLSALIVLVLAAPAGARIVPQKSIAGVALGMSMEEVAERFGNPVSRQRTEGSTIWRFPRTLTVVFDDRAKGVTLVGTRSRRQRTASGIGVGSTRKQVRRALKGEHCSPALCLLGDGSHRSRSTYFSFGIDGKGPVESVEVRYELLDGLP